MLRALHAEKKGAEARRVVGKLYNGKKSVYTFNNYANNSEKAEKKIKLKWRWLVFNVVRHAVQAKDQQRGGILRVTFNTTLSELTVNDSLVISATTLQKRSVL